jgi:hypothetical protein
MTNIPKDVPNNDRSKMHMRFLENELIRINGSDPGWIVKRILSISRFKGSVPLSVEYERKNITSVTDLESKSFKVDDFLISTCQHLILSIHNVTIDCPDLNENDPQINCGINTILAWSQTQSRKIYEVNNLDTF